MASAVDKMFRKEAGTRLGNILCEVLFDSNNGGSALVAPKSVASGKEKALVHFEHIIFV